MRGDAWRISGRVDVAGPLFDNLGMRGAKADQDSSYPAMIATAARTLFRLNRDENMLTIYIIL